MKSVHKKISKKLTHRQQKRRLLKIARRKKKALELNKSRDRTKYANSPKRDAPFNDALNILKNR